MDDPLEVLSQSIPEITAEVVTDDCEQGSEPDAEPSVGEPVLPEKVHPDRESAGRQKAQRETPPDDQPTGERGFEVLSLAGYEPDDERRDEQPAQRAERADNRDRAATDDADADQRRRQQERFEREQPVEPTTRVVGGLAGIDGLGVGSGAVAGHLVGADIVVDDLLQDFLVGTRHTTPIAGQRYGCCAARGRGSARKGGFKSAAG